MLLWLSLARYQGYNAGMLDLGNMSQAVWSGTQGKPLVVTFPDGPLSRLAHHVELVYYLFVPFYALWPDPQLLLTGQALLFLLGTLPVYRMTFRQTGSIFAARCLSLIYLLYPAAQTAVLFDFHGDTLAMPLLLFALDALDTRAWRTWGMLLVLALSCKFYVALPVVGVGGYLLLWGGRPGDRKAGMLTVLAALLYGAAAFFIIRPLFVPTDGGTGVPGTSGTLGTPGEVASIAGSYLSFYFGHFPELWATLGDRLLSAVVVFGPAMLVAWRGWRWLLPGLPVAAAMLLSTGPGGSYDFRYHHYALVVPFIIMAAIDGVAQQKAAALNAPSPHALLPPRSRVRRSWRSDLGITLGSVVLFSSLLVDTPLNPLFWLGVPGQGFDPSAYGITPRDRVKDRFLEEHISPRVPLASSMFLAPHVANRETLYAVRYADDPGAVRLPSLLPHVDYVLADALFDFFVPLSDGSYGGGVAYEREAIGLMLRDPVFHLVAARDGLLLFRRDAPPEQRLLQYAAVVEPEVGRGMAEELRPPVSFGDRVSLVRAEITPEVRGLRRYRVTFEWVATGSSPSPQDDLAVSTLGEVETMRMVHLPSYALLPTSRWEPGQHIREIFEVELPQDVPPGRYPWRVGWYTLASPYSYATDARSRLPGTQEVEVGGRRGRIDGFTHQKNRACVPGLGRASGDARG
ncbi:MAG: DUF2079 domain-containing protein, partial [Chloroflexaceae bacterium]|nr:DUF2079 domain-containing protein [Chloroflexaceae bacterium]